MKHIGTAIRRVRINLGLNQQDIGEKCGISQTSISQIEKGHKTPTTNNLKKICEVLNVHECYLRLLCVEISDVPEVRRQTYTTLTPAMKTIIEQMFNYNTLPS